MYVRMNMPTAKFSIDVYYVRNFRPGSRHKCIHISREFTVSGYQSAFYVNKRIVGFNRNLNREMRVNRHTNTASY